MAAHERPADDRPPLRAVEDPPQDSAALPPQDVEAEQAVLGSVLYAATVDNDAAINRLNQTPDPKDYYRPAHEEIAHQLAYHAKTGLPLDPVAVKSALADMGALGRVGGAPYLHTLVAAAAPDTSLEFFSSRVRRLARRRRTIENVTRAGQQLQDIDTEPLDVLSTVLDDIDTALRTEISGATRLSTLAIRNIDEVLGGDDDEYDWIVPGLLERGDRLIVTGPEGGGKSTLLRQLAFQLAAGVHPFTGDDFRPLRVFLVDCENSERQFRRKARPLRVKLGDDLDPTRFDITFRTEGIDLTQADDVEWLQRHVAASRPDILMTGPIYKLANGDPKDEESAKPVAMALDRIRGEFGTAVILEAHSAKALGGAKKRAHEPYGWSGWLRWPEFGIWLDRDGEIDHWRGMRDEREWPDMLQRGGDWPWTVADSQNAGRWVTIRDCLLAAGQKLPDRKLSELTGIPRSTVQRVIGEYAMHYQALLDQLAEGDE